MDTRINRLAVTLIVSALGGPALAQAPAELPWHAPEPVADAPAKLPAPATEPRVTVGPPAPANGQTPNGPTTGNGVHPNHRPPQPTAGAPGKACNGDGRWMRNDAGRCSTGSSYFHPANWLQPVPSQPLGSLVAEHYRQHVSNAQAVRMILFDFDFVAGDDALNDKGKQRLIQIAAAWGQCPFPVVVERTPCTPALAEARREAVLKTLASFGVPATSDRVVIGSMVANPLAGPEAEIIYSNLQQQTQFLGLPYYISGLSSGGTSGGQGNTGSGSGNGSGTGSGSNSGKQ